MLSRASSTRRRTPSIQPKHSAASTQLRPGEARQPGSLLVEADQELGAARVMARQPA
jgi:hypothetical protein